MAQVSKMVITDLDGTLLHSNGTVSSGNYAMLIQLASQSVLRVVATGRSLYSARLALSVDFPIDYLIFSSGAGVMDWQQQHVLISHHLPEADIQNITALLKEQQLDFMLHQPVPNNHHFHYFASEGVTLGHRNNADFQKRCEHYRSYSQPAPAQVETFSAASQFLVIEPAPTGPACYDALQQQLSDYSIIRTTSPFDGISTWIEIFPAHVSKGQSAQWLADYCGVAEEKIMAIGNDYNDIDLLDWCPQAFIMANAPEPLKQRYGLTGSNDEDGFAQAVKSWLSQG